jgi:type IV pilus assembly protein PilY1
MKTQIRILQVWLAFIGIAAWNCSNAAALNLVSSPLFLGTSVDANVFFELDDSGSMDWETLTNEFDYYLNYWDTSANVAKIDHSMWESYASTGSSFTGQRSYGYIYGNSDRLYQGTGAYGAVALLNPESLQRDWRARSSAFNLIYYNPEVSYAPWVGMTNASFSSARSNPQSGTDGYSVTRNLAGFVFEVWVDDHGYSGTRPDGPDTATDTANGIVDLWDSRIKFTVNATDIVIDEYTVPTDVDDINVNCTLTHAQATVPYSTCYGTTVETTTVGPGDINAWGRTLTEEQQNIANWYSFARKRSYIAKAAIAAVVDDADDFRYGLSLINNDDDLFVQVPGSAVTNYASHNTALLADLYDYEWAALGTPLRLGLQNIGRYFDGVLSGKTDPIWSACQQNFTLLLTDGYWSDGDPAAVIGDADGDGRNRTLADVARYYYNKDLSALANTVPTSVADSNNKQHMVTFGVGFGVRGDLVDTDGDGNPNPELEVDDTWGTNPYSNDPGKIDDLWHAAFNSKGTYVTAQTPEDVVNSLQEALSEISDRVGSSASVATNSGSLNAGSHVFQARFDSGEWSGQLIAFALNLDGTVDPVPSWEASDVLDTQNYNTGRVILTYNPSIDSPVGGAVEGKGIPFRFPAAYKTPNTTSDLSTAQLQLLMKYAPYTYSTNTGSQITANQNHGVAMLNYLRGQRTNEGSGTYAFRIRNSVLGDIVDSDPQYVGAPRFRYPDGLGASAYSTFATTYANRTPMVYVGANDGMLHGFAESNGQEKLAYIPNKVIKNLPELSRTAYAHQYFVNEQPTVVDAFLPNYNATGAWRTILVGGLGRGGQGIYALDVTDPSTFTEANAGNIALWEFTDADSADLGYTYSAVSIGKMHNGKWAAVFGNGYNNTEADGTASTTGRASLFVVDIETGDLIKKIDTEVGSTGTPNGLSSPALIDIDQDYVIDYVYAGDLQGNMWKFDVGDSNAAQWDVAYKTGATPKALFSTGSTQPITTAPQIAAHPTEDGYLVFFGTGKYLETGDNDPTGASTQAFYGIWDKDLSTHTTFTTANLVQQFITNQYAKNYDTDDDGVNDLDHTVRDVSDNAIDYASHMGWYMELKPQKVSGVTNTNNFGEKQVTNAILRGGRVIFTTLIPSQNQCEFGGSSFIMQLDFRNGGLLDDPPFDLSGDGSFSSDDGYIGGSQSKTGITPTLSIILNGDQELGITSGSKGDDDSGSPLGTIPLNAGVNAIGRQSWRQVK